MSKKSKKQNKNNTKKLGGEKGRESNVRKENAVSKIELVIQVIKFVMVVVEFINWFL
ncbi:hypothetical protein [Bacillus toyonensis]|uniref:hypothetical protein n=1 Tax=Bacillus toyonensis TaxID=155322 RepID=UPI00027960CF|nr:hypothetical protein [Bacillus toyonensis]EJQ72877.1 hypothetical protein IGK_05544 [Bacillus toyonensis]